MDPETGRIKLGWEIVAGGTAGGCQVVCYTGRLYGHTFVDGSVSDIYQSP